MATIESIFDTVTAPARAYKAALEDKTTPAEKVDELEKTFRAALEDANTALFRAYRLSITLDGAPAVALWCKRPDYTYITATVSETEYKVKTDRALLTVTRFYRMLKDNEPAAEKRFSDMMGTLAERLTAAAEKARESDTRETGAIKKAAAPILRALTGRNVEMTSAAARLLIDQYNQMGGAAVNGILKVGKGKADNVVTRAIISTLERLTFSIDANTAAKKAAPAPLVDKLTADKPAAPAADKPAAPAADKPARKAADKPARKAADK